MLGVPSVASVTMGSALGLVAARAIGAAPDQHDAHRPDGGQGPQQVRRAEPVEVAGTGTDGCGRGRRSFGRRRGRGFGPDRQPDHGQVAGRRRAAAIGIIELGSVPTPPKKPRSWTKHPVGQAQHGTGDDADAQESDPPAHETGADADQGHHHHEVDRPPVSGVERCEGPQPRGQERRLGDLAHLGDHGREGPGGRGQMGLARPGPPSRPGLEDAHPDEEGAHSPQEPPAELGRLPAPVGQRHQYPGHDIEEDRRRGRRTASCAGAEDAAEGLAEHPDDQAPARAHQPGAPRPVPAGGDQQEHPDADLDPDGGGGGGDRMVGPDGGPGVDQVLHPPR